MEEAEPRRLCIGPLTVYGPRRNGGLGRGTRILRDGIRRLAGPLGPRWRILSRFFFTKAASRQFARRNGFSVDPDLFRFGSRVEREHVSGPTTTKRVLLVCGEARRVIMSRRRRAHVTMPACYFSCRSSYRSYSTARASAEPMCTKCIQKPALGGRPPRPCRPRAYNNCVESCACSCTPHFGPVLPWRWGVSSAGPLTKLLTCLTLAVQPSNVVTRRGHHGRATMHLADSRHFRHKLRSISAHQNNASLSREVSTRVLSHPLLGRSRPAAKASDVVKETVVKRAE